MKQMHILDQMKPKEVAEPKAQSVVKTFRHREIIFRREDTPKYLYVLLEGAACVFDNIPDGIHSILTITREPMDCFAGAYLLIGGKLPFSAEATKKSTVFTISRSMLHRSPRISRNLNVMLSQKAYTLSRKLELSIKDSLCKGITEYMQQHPDVLSKHHELASFLGISRPALSRELYRMTDDGPPVLDEHEDFKMVV